MDDNFRRNVLGVSSKLEKRPLGPTNQDVSAERKEHHEMDQENGQAHERSQDNSEAVPTNLRDCCMKGQEHRTLTSTVKRNRSISAARVHPAVATYDNPDAKSYLYDLIDERVRLNSISRSLEFKHIRRLLDDRIRTVRDALGEALDPIENNGEILRSQGVLTSQKAPRSDLVLVQQKVFAATKEYPEYNFRGRIIGPRGITIKQLESFTGCRMLLRGGGTKRDKRRSPNKDGSGNEQENLYVIVQCRDVREVAEAKLKHAVDCVRFLLTPPPEGQDMLKRKQLMELAVINGTFHPTSALKNFKKKDMPATGPFQAAAYSLAFSNPDVFGSVNATSANSSSKSVQLSANISSRNLVPRYPGAPMIPLADNKQATIAFSMLESFENQERGW